MSKFIVFNRDYFYKKRSSSRLCHYLQEAGYHVGAWPHSLCTDLLVLPAGVRTGAVALLREKSGSASEF